MSIQVSGVYGGGSKINGVKGEYLATANISKGDFVQLTTKGVEEVAFTQLTTLETNAMNAYISAAVLSETQVIICYVERTTSSSTSGNSNVFAQVFTYENGAWVAGIKLQVVNATTAHMYSNISVCRLTDTRAAMIFLCSSYNMSQVCILDINGSEITVAASANKIDSNFSSDGIGSAISAKTVSLKSDTFVSLTFSGGYARVWVHTFTDGTITTGLIGSLHDSTTQSQCYICKLNEQTALVAFDVATVYYILSVAGNTGSLVKSNLDKETKTSDATTGGSGTLISWSENTAICAEYSNSTSSSYITEYNFINYDPAEGTLSRGDIIGEEDSKPLYYSYDAHKMSDSELIVLVSDDNSPAGANDTLYFMKVDVANGIYSAPILSPLSAAGNQSWIPITYSGFGWMVAFSGITSVLIAPLVSTVTAEPFVYRIDGVASKGATAGQMAEVITP